VWSLGCMLAELATGYPLFPGGPRRSAPGPATWCLGSIPARWCLLAWRSPPSQGGRGAGRSRAGLERARTPLRTHMCIYTYTYTHTRAREHTHTHMHTQLHTPTHAHTLSRTTHIHTRPDPRRGRARAASLHHGGPGPAAQGHGRGRAAAARVFRVCGGAAPAAQQQGCAAAGRALPPAAGRAFGLVCTAPGPAPAAARGRGSLSNASGHKPAPAFFTRPQAACGRRRPRRCTARCAATTPASWTSWGAA
jgi:hypothetical protein